MNFTPQKYALEDLPHQPFIDPEEIRALLSHTPAPTPERLDEILARSQALSRLTMGEVAELLAVSDPVAVGRMMEAAQSLKKKVYGNRIVLFAPLYVGNRCINNCLYCGFRASNRSAMRRTLCDEELREEVRSLERVGHKRLILVYGEHPQYDADYIAHTVELAYGVREGSGEIRRININAAPLSVEGFARVAQAGIGTYQIFQETYDPVRYKQVHPSGPKADYHFRVGAMDRAMEAGIDDVGLGVLLGLGEDWRYELLALIRHTNHLEACFGVGPHTLSFPRIKEASSVEQSSVYAVSDADFMRFVAILRLAVPYTGLILTAREEPELRDRLIAYGVSQIDAGSHLEIGGYSEAERQQLVAAEQESSQQEGDGQVSGSQMGGEQGAQRIHRKQFALGDERSLEGMIATLVERKEIPSFCTACYRKGRTGEHFMEFSTQGFIKRFCTPNALLTFAEYLEDYASEPTRAGGWSLIEEELSALSDSSGVRERLEQIKAGARDLLY